MQFKLEDMIYAGKYTEVCDYSWKDYNGSNLPSGIWHVDTASIPEFFNKINNNGNKYIVVSPSCDFGVCYQEHNKPSYDLAKWVSLQMHPDHGYNDLHMKARINEDRCHQHDKYSIKCWSYTEATFPSIPNNVVHWFVVNCEINDPKVTAIPFGIFGNKYKLETAKAIYNYPQKKRDKLLYVNFQFYTTTRYELFVHFKNHFGDKITCKHQCSFNEYLEDLATHKFVLCPTGNGLDCYRTLEAIYMGAIPVVEQKMGAVLPYKDMQYPMLVYPNLFMCTPKHLNEIYVSDGFANCINLEKVLWSYWRNQIEQCRSRL